MWYSDYGIVTIPYGILHVVTEMVTITYGQYYLIPYGFACQIMMKYII